MAFKFRFEVQQRYTRDGNPFVSLRFADDAEYHRFTKAMIAVVAKLRLLGEVDDAAVIDNVLHSPNVKLFDNAGHRFATVLNMFDDTGMRFLEALTRASIILAERDVI